ncbi:MAG: hypothetical protein RBT35_04110 [Bacteroidales bacterium]|jgi:hypothetical protein|nr:hypothetical protein [Bacteroidales bacterium]
MKVKSFFALAAISVALVSCGTKEAPVSEQLVGQWNGNDAITVSILDSTGTPVPQMMEAPMELTYNADSSLVANLMINDSTTVVLEAKATVADALVNFQGTMTCAQVLQVTGDITLQGKDTLVVNYIGVNTEAGITHEGKALVVRKVVENVEAAPVQ